VLSLLSYLSYKLYKRIKELIKLSQTLPEYLNNIYQEKPKTNISYFLGKLELKLKFTKETIDNHSDIEDTIMQYINDFYPSLSACKVNLKIKSYLQEDEQEKCCCCNSEEDE